MAEKKERKGGTKASGGETKRRRARAEVRTLVLYIEATWREAEECYTEVVQREL